MIWRHVVLLDLVAIAGGFVLRAVAGGVAAPVALSRWFVLVVTAAAILVAAGKRHAELSAALRPARPGGGYSRCTRRGALDGLARQCRRGARRLLHLGVQAPGVHGIPWRPLTIVPFAICLARYGALIRSGRGEAPEELILTDRGWRSRPRRGCWCSRSASPPAEAKRSVAQSEAIAPSPVRRQDAARRSHRRPARKYVRSVAPGTVGSSQQSSFQSRPASSSTPRSSSAAPSTLRGGRISGCSTTQ